MFILGKKIGMTQMFSSVGLVTPITVIQVSPNVITQVRTKEKDAYLAVQLGFGSKKKINKPLAGHLKDLNNSRYLREFRLNEGQDVGIRGTEISISSFKEGEVVDVCGISKSFGFQGVVKRHGFAGASRTHGTKHAHREPGSIGSTWPQRVIKGKKMAGRMGGERKTVKNLTIMKIDQENNLLAVSGAVPGRKGVLLKITKSGTKAKYRI